MFHFYAIAKQNDNEEGLFIKHSFAQFYENHSACQYWFICISMYSSDPLNNFYFLLVTCGNVNVLFGGYMCILLKIVTITWCALLPKPQNNMLILFTLYISSSVNAGETACKKLTLLNKHYGTTNFSINSFKVPTRRQTVPEDVVQEEKSADRWRICFLQGQSPRSVIQYRMINPQLLCIGISNTGETR